MTMDREVCIRFAREWIDAFNAADLERITGHYAPDVELVSPLYAVFSGGGSDRVRGTAELRRYFAAALTAYPNLRFELLEVAVGARGLSLRYHTNVGDRVAHECLEFDDELRAARVLCHYLPAAGMSDGGDAGRRRETSDMGVSE